MGVTGAKRASRTKVGSTPPSLPKTKLGRRITCSSPDSLVARSISHFARKYGTASFVRSSSPSALSSTKQGTPESRAGATRSHVPRGADEIPCALRHHALEVGGRTVDDRHEMDDGVDAGAGGVQRCRIGDVA